MSNPTPAPSSVPSHHAQTQDSDIEKTATDTSDQSIARLIQMPSDSIASSRYANILRELAKGSLARIISTDICGASILGFGSVGIGVTCTTWNTLGSP